MKIQMSSRNLGPSIWTLFVAAIAAALTPVNAFSFEGNRDSPPVGLSVFVNAKDSLMAVCGFMDNGKPGNAHDHMKFEALYHVPGTGAVAQQADALRKSLSASSGEVSILAYDKWAEIVSVPEIPEISVDKPAETDALVGIGNGRWIAKTIGHDSRLVPVDSSEQDALRKKLKSAERQKLGEEEAKKLQAQIDRMAGMGAAASAYLLRAEETLRGLCAFGNASVPQSLPQGWTFSFAVGSKEEADAAQDFMTASALYITSTARDRLPVRPKEYIVLPDGTLRAASPPSAQVSAEPAMK